MSTDPLASMLTPPADTKVVIDIGTCLEGWNVYRVYAESPVITDWDVSTVKEFTDAAAGIAAATALAVDGGWPLIDRRHEHGGWPVYAPDAK